MAMKIRLARGGSKKRPHYSIVAADSRMARDGRFIEKLGTYNPQLAKDDENRIKMDMERVQYWLGTGAQPTDRVSRFLEAAGVGTKGHFVEDHPAAAILEVANEIGADLIIVGSRGLGRATRFLRGSVSTRVADHAETSFMVIQDDDHTDG